LNLQQHSTQWTITTRISTRRISLCWIPIIGQERGRDMVRVRVRGGIGIGLKFGELKRNRMRRRQRGW